MSKAVYIQRGEALDYKNETEAKILANTILELASTRIGIAGTDIAVGEVGDIHVSGVFEIKKTSTNAIALGTNVYFDGEGITEDKDNGKTSTEKVTYTPAGYAAEKSAAGASVIAVKIG